MKKFAIIFTAIFAASTGLFAQSNGTIKLAKGQNYVVENKLTTNSSSEMQGQSMETTADVTSVYNITIDDFRDNNYNMTNKLSSVKLTMTSMGQNINFDSEKKEDMDGQMGTAFQPIINQPNPVLMDKSGNIIPVKETDSSKEKAATEQTKMILKQMGDPDQQGYGAKMAFIPIPENVKTGTAWQDSTSADGVTRVSNYVVKDISGNKATISVSGTESRDTKMEMQGMEISTRTSGKFTGEQTVDISTGVLLQNNLTSDATGTISVMGQEIPTTIKATSVTTVKSL